MTPGLRRFALTAHVTSSVGWLGAVAGFLALAVASLASWNPQTVRSVYVAMDLMGWFVLVPLSLASLFTGLVQSLGTSWGLLRHYWVIIKLVVNLVSTVVLLMYTQTLVSLADRAKDTAISDAELLRLRDLSPVLHAGVALTLLVIAVTLSIYKPRGMTCRGQRKQHQGSAHQQSPSASADTGPRT